jgi:hypothetical protein
MSVLVAAGQLALPRLTAGAGEEAAGDGEEAAEGEQEAEQEEAAPEAGASRSRGAGKHKHQTKSSEGLAGHSRTQHRSPCAQTDLAATCNLIWV